MDLKDANLVYVDDNKFNIALIKAFADELGINLVTFLNAKEALNYVLNNDVDIVLLDYMMPDMNGLEFARILKAQKPDILIIMISAFDDYKLRAQAKKLGIEDFLPKPVDFDNFKLRVAKKILSMERKKDSFENNFQIDKSIYHIFGKIMIPKDKNYKNLLNIATISKIIASEVVDKEFAEKIFKASFFYDIGKNKIPTEILLKPSKLSPEEFELVKTHTILGYEMLNESDEILQIAAIMALSHHEKFDGNGYPQKLRGENIPLCARIIAISDVFDALVSRKSYKDAMAFDNAVEIIINEKRRSFDPELVEAFSSNIEKIRILY